MQFRSRTPKSSGTPNNHEFEVFCNGERLPDCFEADDAAGWADSHVPGDGGYAVDALGLLKVVRLTGAVQILRVNTDEWPMATAARMAKRAEFFAELEDEKHAEPVVPGH